MSPAEISRLDSFWKINMLFDTLGDRMKWYENQYFQQSTPYLPLIVRLDGVGFHNYTKQFKKPFDDILIEVFDLTTKWLMEVTNAKLGYTQSDEISLLLYSGDPKSQLYFDGKIQKIQSVLAAKASIYFFSQMGLRGIYEPPFFDCRAFNVPTITEAFNQFIWREQDATRNSIQGLAQSLYSHNELQGKNCNELQEMIFQKGINWAKIDQRKKNGKFFAPKYKLMKYTAEELERLPLKHEARSNPNLMVERRYIEEHLLDNVNIDTLLALVQ